MTRKALLLALTAASAAVKCSTARLLIGDVIAESEDLRGSSISQERNQPRRSLNEQNEAILKAMLGKERFNVLTDECLHETSPDGTPVYGRCDIQRFPYCTGDRPNICFNRINRQDSFWPDKHPRYYIDYNRVLCYPDRMYNVDFTCSSCSPGRWCEPEGRCILDENMYSCWAAEDAAAAEDEAAEDAATEDAATEDAATEDEAVQMEARTAGSAGV